MPKENFFEDVYQVVRLIPQGKVVLFFVAVFGGHGGVLLFQKTVFKIKPGFAVLTFFCCSFKLKTAYKKSTSRCRRKKRNASPIVQPHSNKKLSNKKQKRINCNKL